MIEVRLRSKAPESRMQQIKGKLPSATEYDLMLTGACKVYKPNGAPLCVYLPRELAEFTDGPTYDILHSLRTQVTDNRGDASGSPRVQKQGEKRSRTKPVASAMIGSFDPAGAKQFCRLSAWTGTHVPEWELLRPMMQTISAAMEKHVPVRYKRQMEYVERTSPDWVVPGTPFTTVTVNNTYSTGVHTDSGDLEEGFSTLACLRKGKYEGGYFVIPQYRVAVDMQDGDLLLLDAHEWHGNTAMTCPHSEKPLSGICEGKVCERITVVCYYRTKIAQCGSEADEMAKAHTYAEKRANMV